MAAIHSYEASEMLVVGDIMGDGLCQNRIVVTDPYGVLSRSRYPIEVFSVATTSIVHKNRKSPLKQV